MTRVIFAWLGAAVILLAGCSAGGSSAPEQPPGSAAPSGEQTSAPAPAGTATPVDSRGRPSVVATNDPLQVYPPVPIDQPQQVAGVEVRLAQIDAIQTEAKMPGEVAGPGLAVLVELKNQTAETIEIDSLVVVLYDSAMAPAGAMSATSDAVQASLAPGEVLSGTYRFTIAPELRSPVTIEVSLPNHPVLLSFQGDAPAA